MTDLVYQTATSIIYKSGDRSLACLIYMGGRDPHPRTGGNTNAYPLIYNIYRTQTNVPIILFFVLGYLQVLFVVSLFYFFKSSLTRGEKCYPGGLCFSSFFVRKNVNRLKVRTLSLLLFLFSFS